MFIRIGLIFLLAVLWRAVRAAGAGRGAGAAGAGLAACASRPAGKELTIASLPRSKNSRRKPQPDKQATLLRAASGLRAAANKAQAVLAITACYNVISAALKQASLSG